MYEHTFKITQTTSPQYYPSNDLLGPREGSRRNIFGFYTENKEIQKHTSQVMEMSFNPKMTSESKKDLTSDGKGSDQGSYLKKFADLLKEPKVYHRAFDICPIKKKLRFNQSTKSCEPRPSVKDESVQTEFVPNFFEHSTFEVRKEHLRRSSSLSHRSSQSKAQDSQNTLDTYRLDPIVDSGHLSDKRESRLRESLFTLGGRTDKKALGLFPETRDNSYVEFSLLNIEDHENSKENLVPNYNHELIRHVLEPVEKEKPRNIDSGIFENEVRHNFLPKGQKDNKDTKKNTHFDYKGNLNERSMLKQKENQYPDLNKLQKDEAPRTYGPINIQLIPTSSNTGHPQPDHKSKKRYDVSPVEKKVIKIEPEERIKKPIAEPTAETQFKLIGGDFAEKKGTDISNPYKEMVLKNQTYSNNDIIDIHKLMSLDVINTILSNPDLIIIQGDLMKYKPGIHFNYVKRWVQITKDEIRYYKSRWHANCWDSKPLLTVPFKDIKAVYRVNMKLPKQIKRESNSKRTQRSEPKLYHFEIFTRDHPLPSLDELDSTVHGNAPALPANNKNGEVRDSRSKSPCLLTKNVQTPHSRNVEKNHLMPPPPLSSRKKNEKDLQKNEKNEAQNLKQPALINSKTDCVLGKNRSTPNNNGSSKNLQDLTSPRNMKKPEPAAVSSNKDAHKDESQQSSKKKENNKTMYHYVKNIEDLASWSGRQKEWYYSEKRLLFSTASNKEAEIWISVINWLIQVAGQKN